jgi:VanZ family protein
MTRESAKWPLRIAFIGAVGAIAVLSLLPQSEVPQLGVGDKTLHFCAYAGLALLGGIGFGGPRRALLITIMLIGLGVLLEALQQFSPGRAPEAADAVANAVGAVVGSLAALTLWAIRRHKAVRP